MYRKREVAGVVRTQAAVAEAEPNAAQRFNAPELRFQANFISASPPPLFQCSASLVALPVVRARVAFF